MAAKKSYSQGWIIVGWAALALTSMVALLIAIYGAGEEGVHVVIRATARTSFFLFLTAFTATALVKLWPGAMTKWIRANRRYIGVSFAVSHLLHAIAIVTLAVLTSGAFDQRDRYACAYRREPGLSIYRRDGRYFF